MIRTTKQDVLEEASAMLVQPSKDTKRKILIAVNATFIGSVLLHLTIQFITSGSLPLIERDLPGLILIIISNSFSLFYNMRVLYGYRDPTKSLDSKSLWFTLSVSMLYALAIVHTNPNTATSLLMDFSLSVILIFVIGVLAGRKAVIIWSIISVFSLLVGLYNVGLDFDYYLLTKQEIKEIEIGLEKNNETVLNKVQQMKDEGLMPISIRIFVSVWLIFMLFAFFTTYFESGMISKVLNAIPAVVKKISIASEEKNALEKENLRMGHELDVAKKIQKLLLPQADDFNQFNFLDIAARMDPATEVGGDFYEALRLKDGAALIAVGDVTDHGLQSGLVMFMAQSTIRTLLDNQDITLSQALSRINDIMFLNIRNRMFDYRNLTLVLARITQNEVTLCGQHETVIHYHSATDQINIIKTENLGMYVGLVENIDRHINEVTLPFGHKDILVFYTDGLTEAENQSGDFYGEDRIYQIIKKHSNQNSQFILNAIYDDVYKFIENRELLDDISVVIIKNN